MDWKALSYEDFLNQVINKIETSARETAVADFLHWWEMWKVKNKRDKRVGYTDSDGYFTVEVIKGEWEIWVGGIYVLHIHWNYIRRKKYDEKNDWNCCMYAVGCYSVASGRRSK